MQYKPLHTEGDDDEGDCVNSDRLRRHTHLRNVGMPWIDRPGDVPELRLRPDSKLSVSN